MSDDRNERPWKEIPDRLALYATHPVKTRDFQIPTPPVVRAFDLMVHTIASGAPSCAFVGFPRFGKTWATKYCKSRLREAFPTLPIVGFHAHHELRPNSFRFFKLLLNQSGYDSRTRGADAQEQLVRAWLVLAQSHRSSTLVLIGDEMQCLNEHEFSWLIDVTNDLQALGVRVVSILFGQHEFASRRSLFRQSERGDILGRFMSRVARFDGIASASELRQVFDFYDDPEQEYPEGSGWCFSRFFLPVAYANGWRLASCAGLCWELYKKHAALRLKNPTGNSLRIGMEWIAGSVQFALMYFGDNDHSRFSITTDQWDVAIERSGFDSSLGLTYSPDWSDES